MGDLSGDLNARAYWGIPDYAWQFPEPRLADSQITHRIQGTRWTLHNAFGVDAAQGVCRGRCTPDVTLLSIHYIRKLTLHHIMAYDHQPHHATPLYHSLTHSNQTTSNQLPHQPKSTRLLGLLSAYMRPADLLCMLSAICQAHSHPYVLCSYVACRFRFRFLARVLLRFSSFRICELALSPCLVFVQFNASCRAICLLFSFRLF